MKTLVKNLVFILAVALFVPMVIAQNTPKKDTAPKPPLSPSQSLLDYWNYVGRKLIVMAEDFPEEKYDFRPSSTQRTFAEQLLHAAGANYYFINPATGMKPPTGDPNRSDFKTKAAVVEYVKKSFADGATLIKSKGDKGMNELYTDPFSDHQTRLSDGAWEILEHSGEHYGQLAVYYRVAGLVPPESRPKK
jgi:uncharacterized damage-inducible protein DinB